MGWDGLAMKSKENTEFIRFLKAEPKYSSPPPKPLKKATLSHHNPDFY